MRVLVTGATGFVGRHVVERLVAAGWEVHAVARSPGTDPRLAWHAADLLDPDAAERVVSAAGAQRLLHLAWCTEPRSFWTAPENVLWAEASLRLARAFAASDHAERIVGVGSCAEYDWTGPGRMHETETPLRPGSLYGACKVAVAAVLAQLGVSFSWARLFFVFGPGETGRLVASVAHALARGESPATTSGTQRRDFVHVDDVAAALCTLVESTEVVGPVNVGTGRAVAVKDVVGRLVALAGGAASARVGALPDPQGEPTLVEADTTRLRDELGFRPAVDLDAGLAGTLAWWRGQVGAHA